MKTRLAALLLGIALAIGTTALSPAPASAHNQDGYSYWYCSYHRSADSATVVHSQVFGLWPGQIGYDCRDRRPNGQQHRYWVIVSPPFSDVDNSWRPWPYQECTPHGSIVCPGG